MELDHVATRPVALLTGVGRERGIAAAIARRLASDGWDVACTYWRAYDERMPWRADDEGRRLVLAELQKASRLVADVEADLADPSSIPAVFDAVGSAAGRAVTALVICHAESVDSGILDTTIESFNRHFAVNTRASWLLIREFASRFEVGTHGGRIVALTSDHTVGNLPYGSSKGALDRVVLAAAHELAHLRVTANVVNPGPVDNGWMSDELKASVIAATPLDRLGTPEDVANLVAFLCSPEGEWVNGQLLKSSGGFA